MTRVRRKLRKRRRGFFGGGGGGDEDVDAVPGPVGGRVPVMGEDVAGGAAGVLAGVVVVLAGL